MGIIITGLLILVLELFISVNSAKPEFSALFAIGDSIIDTGNNNHIITLVKANFHPYGIDFPQQIATGRFSNGKLVPDFLAQGLGLKDTLPAYLDTSLTPQNLLTGVSFASAGSGLDNLTGLAFNVIPVLKQLDYFREYKRKIADLFGNDTMQRVVQNAMFLVSAGSNDFLENYFLLSTRRLQYDVKQFQTFLVNAMHDLIQGLFKEGARKIAIAGLAPLGCLPVSRLRHALTLNCSETENQAAYGFNILLQNTLNTMSKTLEPSLKLVFLELYQTVLDIMNNPQEYGIEVVEKGCCGVTGLIEVAILCNEFSPVCTDDSKYLFFDAVHPTEKIYKMLSQTILSRDIPCLS